VGRTPAGGGGLIQPQPLGLVTQPLTQIDVPGPLAVCRRSAALHDLRAYFIAWAANADPTVHYKIRYGTTSGTAQLLHPPPEDPASDATPAGVEQRDPSPRRDEIDGDAIGDSHRQEDPGRGSDPPIYSLDLDPPASCIQGHHLDAVHLVAQRDGREFRQLPAERAPAAHHLTNRCVTPEAEIEPTTGLGAAPGNASHDPVVLPPIRNLEPGNGSWDGTLADLERL
jgi:hypothetical protein